MTRGELLAILYERLNFQTSPATAVTTRLGNHLNQAHRMILRQPGMAKLRDTPAALTFASESTRNYYGLPPVFSQMRAITDRTNDRLLRPLTWAEVRAGDPGLDASGPPYGYIHVGRRSIARLPATTGLWAASSQAADTSQVVQANGIRTGGIQSGDQSATLSGVTRVAIGGASAFTDFLDVETLSMTAAATGLVSIYDASSSGNTLAEIPIGHLYPLYQGVYLYPTPTSAITYYVDGPTRVLDMDDAHDVPMLPEEFHDLLIPGALMFEYEKNNDPRRKEAKEIFLEGVSALKFHLSSSPDDIPVMGQTRIVRSSRLGAWTPAGSGY